MYFIGAQYALCGSCSSLDECYIRFYINDTPWLTVLNTIFRVAHLHVLLYNIQGALQAILAHVLVTAW